MIGEKLKVNFILAWATKAQREVELYLYYFYNLGARWGDWLTPRSSSFNPGRDPVPTVQKVVSASGLVVTSAKNLASIGIRTPDSPGRSESLQVPTKLPRPMAGLRIIQNAASVEGEKACADTCY